MGVSVTDATGSVAIQAVGNTWTANVEGANGFGGYAAALVTGPAGGQNYVLNAATQSIQF